MDEMRSSGFWTKCGAPHFVQLLLRPQIVISLMRGNVEEPFRAALTAVLGSGFGDLSRRTSQPLGQFSRCTKGKFRPCRAA